MLCGLSETPGMMIVGQGFTGGAMTPTAPDDRLDPAAAGAAADRHCAVRIHRGDGAVAGPIIGGWLTKAYSWHDAFFINVPIGIGLVYLLLVGLPHAKSRLSLIRQADWLSIVGLALFLGALTIVLEGGAA